MAAPMLGFVPLVLMVLLPAVFVRIAAPLARVGISWRLALGFGLVAAILSGLERVLLQLTHVQLPLLLAVALGAGMYVVVGAWLFTGRGTTREGRPLDRRGALVFMLFYLAIAASFLGFAVALQHFSARPA
jgi:hypothetical protein